MLQRLWAGVCGFKVKKKTHESTVTTPPRQHIDLWEYIFTTAAFELRFFWIAPQRARNASAAFSFLFAINIHHWYLCLFCAAFLWHSCNIVLIYRSFLLVFPWSCYRFNSIFTGHKAPADTGEFRATRGARGCSISMTESFQGAHRYRSGAVTHFCLGWWNILKSIINNICVARFFLAEMVAEQRSTWRLFFARQSQIG